MKNLKNFEVKLYLEGWVNEVGYSYSPEMTLLEAMRENNSLIDWFGTKDIDYNDDFALDYINKLYEQRS
jgi:hypothetical protein